MNPYSLTKNILKAMDLSVDDLTKFTGKHLFNIMKSINKNKAAVNAHLKESPVKGAKTADSLVKKIAQAKNKRKDYVIDQDAENIYGKIAKTAFKDGKEVNVSLRKKGGTITKRKKGGKVDKKVKQLYKTMDALHKWKTSKRKKGGKVGSGSAFVASLYK
jgi:hypothetical protein